MDKLNVLVLARLRLHQGAFEEIAEVDPRISVKDGTDALVAELKKSARKEPRVRYFISEATLGGAQPLPGEQEDLDALLTETDVLFAGPLLPDRLLQRAPRLKWVHLAGTGIDAHLSSGIFDADLTVTNSRGIVAIPIAEHTLAFILMLAKDAPRLLDNKKKKNWDPFATREVRDRTVGIIGLGAIGSEVARLARGIGMRVVATRRSAERRESDVSGVDELYPSRELLSMLAESDFVVVAAPLTAETKKMIGVTQLKAMKPGAYLINVARGQIVDQLALVKALKGRWIAGAALDVFEAEPLPADSKLWELPNVILSYHMAGFADRHSQRVLAMFNENLRRYLAGEPMLNVVGRSKDY